MEISFVRVFEEMKWLPTEQINMFDVFIDIRY